MRILFDPRPFVVPMFRKRFFRVSRLCLLTRTVLSVVVLLIAQPLAAANAPIKQWMRDSGAPRAVVGIDVRSVSGENALLRVNSKRPMNPASVIKILTTWAAVGSLGADFQWRTRFFLDGKMENGVLDGDLIVQGGGDPKLVVEDLTELVIQMREAGLKHIRGDLLLDDSLYVVSQRRGPSFDGLDKEPYNVRPSAVMMNFKSTKFTVVPANGLAQVTLDPPLANVAIDNQIKLVKGRCRHKVNQLDLSQAGTEQQPVIRLQGRYSVGCKTQHAFNSVLNHRQFIDGFFRAGWLAAGGKFDGITRMAPRAVETLTADTGMLVQPFFEWVSPRNLGQIAADINKFSNNVMTRQLLLHLAAASGVKPATRFAGLETVRGWLAMQGIRAPELIIENGSGLSRTSRISASSLSRVLIRMHRSRHGKLMRTSLPVAGVDGTMRWRLNKHPVSGRAWIKTGSLDGVRSVAGYVLAKSGVMYAVTMLVNGKGARRAHRAQDKLIAWVYDNG